MVGRFNCMWLVLARSDNPGKMQGKVVNRPLAGTRRRGKTDKEDQLMEQELLADEKECAEHVMLVDLGRNDVGKVRRFQ
jgi:anthranilate synthase component 1